MCTREHSDILSPCTLHYYDLGTPRHIKVLRTLRAGKGDQPKHDKIVIRRQSSSTFIEANRVFGTYYTVIIKIQIAVPPQDHT